MTSIGNYSFIKCNGLTGITISDSVISIGAGAFLYCDGLTSVNFGGTIPSSDFSDYDPFPGDLRTKFYATDKTNGTPGTYTRANGSEVWTRIIKKCD